MKQISLNAKIMGIIVGLSLACCGVAALGLNGMSTTYENLSGVSRNLAQRKELWSEIRVALLSVSIWERDYFNQYVAEKRKPLVQSIDADKKVIDDSLLRIENTSIDTADKAKVAEVRTAIGAWWANHLTVREKMEKDDRDGARDTSRAGRTLREPIEKLLADINTQSEKLLNEQGRQAQETYGRTFALLVWITASAVLLALGLSFWLTTRIRRSLSAVIENLAQNSVEVENTSARVAQSATKLSQSTTEQAASLQQTAASAQEMTSMVQRNMENAQSAASTTASSQTSAQKGQQVVQDMGRAITEINSSNQDIMNQVNQSNTQISEITKVISEIGSKTKVINDIVFQTKLLSFNASVEAARAGEHGRGFAVVAEEVGNLARMSGNAAKEINDMLDASIKKVNQIVEDMKNNVERLVFVGREKVEIGGRIAGECGGVLSEIVDSVIQVSRMSSDISSASQEQAQGMREISRAVSQLDSVTQSNAGSAEQAAEAADQLSDQAKSLKATVQDLMKIVNGGDSSEAGSKSQTVLKSKNPAAQQGRVSESKRSQAVSASADSTAIQRSKAPAPSRNETAQKAALNVVRSNGPSASKMPAKASSSPQARTPQPPAIGQALKLTAGAEAAIPSENDPRFKDV